MSENISQRRFLRRAMTTALLEREHEIALFIRWRTHNDQSALNTLIEAHMRLAIALAARYKNYGLPMGDLVQEGSIGLLEAASRFDVEREVRFSTYATWWIRATLQDYVLRNWSIVRGGTSAGQKSLFFNLRRLRAKLAKNGEECISDDAYDSIASEVGVSRADVIALDARIASSDVSLNVSIGDNENGSTTDRMDFLIDESPRPDEHTEAVLDGERRQGWLKEALTVLNGRELDIVNHRRLREKQVTLEDLSTRWGLSKERVRQIENRAMQKLKVALYEKIPAFAA
jgi:RNA polymerase sigma-32 factor